VRLLARDPAARQGERLNPAKRRREIAEPPCPTGLDERFASVPVRLGRRNDGPLIANAPQRAGAAQLIRWRCARRRDEALPPSASLANRIER
jgi:hypothetical protein